LKIEEHKFNLTQQKKIKNKNQQQIERDKVRYQQEWIRAMESALTCCGCEATTNLMFDSSSSFPPSYYFLPSQFPNFYY
jgi:hypothetical protein